MSKFSKFKPVLTTDETASLLTRLTGEAVNADTILRLGERCYLTPILCYGSRVVGFDYESTEALFSNGKVTPQAESVIGIVSCKFVFFEDAEACIVDSESGETLFFFIDVSDGQKAGEVKEVFELKDLKPIATSDLETYFYSYEEVRRVADLANDDANLPPLPNIRPLQVRFSEEDSRFAWPSADQLSGLQTDSGVFSMSASAIEALSQGGAQARKPLHPSERKSTGQIIATLAAMAGLDLSTPYKAVDPLRAAAAVRGLELPGSDETIVKFLKDAAARMGKS